MDVCDVGIDSAAYENWERTAMDGVALVADAAQQLEFSLSNQSLSFNADKITSTSSLNNLCAVNGNTSTFVLVI